jgi:hypothetical protein
MRFTRRIALGAVVVATAALSLPAAAPAATYTDFLCVSPSGGAAPATGLVGAAASGAEATNTCGAPGGVARVGLGGSGPWPIGAGASQKYDAPPDTSIAAFEVNRRTGGLRPPSGANQGRVYFEIDSDTEMIDGCGNLVPCQSDVAGSVGRAGMNAKWLLFRAGCTGVYPDLCQASSAGAPRLELTSGKVVLNDSIAPASSNLRGSLLSPGQKRGQVSAEFDATDQGGGLARLITVIDGKETENRGLDQGQGTCQDIAPGNSDAHEYAGKVPCPTAIKNVATVIDTSKLSDDKHNVQLFLEDAAGNRSPVFGPQGIDINVFNAVPNGIGADRQARLTMWFVKNRKQRLTGRAGTRYVTRGRIVDRRGRGIRAARITVYHYVRGKPRLLKTGLRSRRQGRLTLILPMNLYGDRNGWRRLRFDYRAFRPGPVTSRRTLRLRILDRNGRPVTGMKKRAPSN